MLGKYNKEWHETGILAFCIFTMIMSLYSALDLHGFFVADFFKNKAFVQIFGQSFKLSELASNSAAWLQICLISGFFATKILLSIGILKAKSNGRRLISMVALYVMYAMESVVTTSASCGSGDGTVYMCAESHLVEPIASYIVCCLFIVIMFKQFHIVFKENNTPDNVEIETTK